MERITQNVSFSFNLRIASFDIPPPVHFPIFILGLLVYMFSFLCNLTILVLIITQRSLHKPMFYILFNLPLNDLIGITAFLPRLLGDIVTQTNFVYYPICVFQGFLLHMYGGGALVILTAMSVDRYFAICRPLRYHSIMTHSTLCVLIFTAWGLDFVLILVLFSLQARVKQCKSFIDSVYCANSSLLRLSCGGDLSINNIYGLIMTAFLQIISIGTQLFSYINILFICVMNRQSDAKSKAVNTCVAQIVSFVLFEFVGTFTIVSHRFPNLSPNVRKFCGTLTFLLLPVINPIIYGMKTKDIRTTFFTVLRKK